MAHKHKCPNPECGHVWKHDTIALRNDREAYNAAHHCPRCGTEQFWKHYDCADDEFEDMTDQIKIKMLDL